MVRGTLYAKAGLVAIAALVVGLLYLRLSAGPLSFSGLPERVAAALAEQIGPGWTVSLKDSAFELEQGSLALRTVGLDIRDPSGALVVRAPNAIVSVDTVSLMTASLQPRSIELRDLQLRATIGRDGALSFAPAGEPSPVPVSGVPAPPAPPAAEPDDPARPSTMSGAIASLFDLVLEPSGIVGALDSAKVSNARLTLVDADGRERAVFGRVEASFDRSDRGRRFDMRLEGPRGPWRLAGEVVGSRRNRAGVIAATDVPVQDLLLLGGLSKLPASTDLKVSGSVQAALRDRAISLFEASLNASPGTIRADDPDMPPIQVDAAAADAAWDEARRTLVLKSLSFRGGETRVALAGELATARDSWRLAVTGKDAVVSGVAEGDPTFPIETVDAVVAGLDGGIALERLALRGPELSADLSGSFKGSGDDDGLRLEARLVGTAARKTLRLWPNSVSPNVREYLVKNLRAGTVDRLGLSLALSGPELAAANSGRPIPDAALKADFAISSAELRVADGLPPLSKAVVTGTVTGAKATVRAPSGQIAMPGGRALAFVDGTFAVPDVWAANSTAKIGFRVEGGADALAAFLQSPALREVGGIELDPAQVSGRTALRVAISLALKDIPKFADLPIAITGAISDLSIEKAFGRERLEGASLAVNYNNGSLEMSGTGKLAGVATALEVRQPREGPGEVSALMTLDEAARARKGLSFGPRLAGPVPVRVVLPLGPGRIGPRIEADLTKAVVDDIVPGWVKPAGRPGRLTFTLVESPKMLELRDLQLESGSVLLKGSAQLSPEGNLERADLSAFKLSAGDDVRVQLERAATGFKVVARGNVADARPFLAGLSPDPGTRQRKGKKAPAPEARDVELDVAVNILTGFNDEAMTNASVKAVVRKNELRQLQLTGKLGASAVSAQTAPQRGAPVLMVQAQDAGALLRFLDIYRRMLRGNLSLQVALGDGVQVGALLVQDFTLRGEPALRRIIPPQLASADDGSRVEQQYQRRIDPNDIGFSRARLDFTRTAGHLAFRDASIVGPEVGFTLSGWVDFSRDTADITGTFVPAFGVNNAFAQVPLFGPLLSGGSNEGLFAVNFRITGQATAPTLNVNPLSAIAPGFLRKLFGVGSSDDAPRVALPSER